MKLILETKKIKKLINKINSIVADFDPINENTGILIETYQNKITLKGQNKNLTIKSEINIKNEDIGNILIKSKIINEAINKIEDHEFEIIKNKNNSISINTNKIKFNLNLLVGNYTHLPKDLSKFINLFTIEGEQFKKIIKSVIFCASDKTPRIMLKSINFKIINNKLFVAASDETKIGINSLLLNSIKDFEFTISLQVVKDLLKLIENSKMDLFINEDQIIILNDDSQIELSIIDNTYPNVLKFIPKTFSREINIEKEEIIRIFNQAMLINNLKTIDETPIKLSLTNKILKLETQDEGIGNVIVETDNFTTNNYDNFVISFNPKFLIESVKNMEGKTILLQFNTYNDPFIVTSPEELDHKVLILPFGKG